MGLYIMHMLSCYIMTSVYAGEAFLKGALCSLYLRLGSGCWSCVIVLLSVSWLIILSPLWSFFHQWCWWLCTVSLHEFLLALSPPESDVFLFTRGSFVMSINCLGIQSIYPKISAILHFSKKTILLHPVLHVIVGFEIISVMINLVMHFLSFELFSGCCKLWIMWWQCNAYPAKTTDTSQPTLRLQSRNFG